MPSPIRAERWLAAAAAMPNRSTSARPETPAASLPTPASLKIAAMAPAAAANLAAVTPPCEPHTTTCPADSRPSLVAESATRTSTARTRLTSRAIGSPPTTGPPATSVPGPRLVVRLPAHRHQDVVGGEEVGVVEDPGLA